MGVAACVRAAAAPEAAPAWGAEGTGSDSEMAASMFYSRLLAAAALRSHRPRIALGAAVQVLLPGLLSRRGSAGERARWGTLSSCGWGVGSRSPAWGHFAGGDISWASCLAGGRLTLVARQDCERTGVCAALFFGRTGRPASAASLVSEWAAGSRRAPSGGEGVGVVSVAVRVPGFRGLFLGRGSVLQVYVHVSWEPSWLETTWEDQQCLPSPVVCSVRLAVIMGWCVPAYQLGK
jgi:hypothetical protein